jgi:hypothetical protein
MRISASGRKPADTSAAARSCKPATKDRVRVIRLQRTFGCKTGVRLAAAVVNGDGYYEDLRYYGIVDELAEGAGGVM